jgi:hypothetical protein
MPSALAEEESMTSGQSFYFDPDEGPFGKWKRRVPSRRLVHHTLKGLSYEMAIFEGLKIIVVLSVCALMVFKYLIASC